MLRTSAIAACLEGALKRRSAAAAPKVLLEHAQRIAGHASPKTTKLYDRTADTITLDEIERIVL